jgi:hypothetical protein
MIGRAQGGFAEGVTRRLPPRNRMFPISLVPKSAKADFGMADYAFG